MYKNSSSTKIIVQTGAVTITPYIDKFQGPNMYYCHLGNVLLIPKPGRLADTRKLSKDLYTKIEILEYYDLAPGEFILAETFEVFSTGKSHAIRLFNSSSLARLGVSQCALGMINPGCGTKSPLKLTLELFNNGPYTVRIYPTVVSKGEVISWGTEVLKVAVCDYETVTQAYDEWGGSLYGSDVSVSGSKIDRRFK